MISTQRVLKDRERRSWSGFRTARERWKFLDREREKKKMITLSELGICVYYDKS